jgi:FkbM family methyltransferase
MPSLIQKIWNKAMNLRVMDQRHLYKYWEQQHLLRLINHYRVDCIFDIGANHGQYASMLRHTLGYKGLIFSFEPNPAAAESVRKLASGDPKWMVEEMAVSVEDGEQTFNVMVDSQFSSLSQPRHDETDLFQSWNQIETSIVVKTETLSTVYHRLLNKFGFSRPFLKMDTQGYDVDIVKNAGSALNQFVGLQSELSVKMIYSDSVDFRDALSIYEKHGFELSAFVPNNGGHFPQLVEIDCIMIRKGS